jgi:putative redox protein
MSTQVSVKLEDAEKMKFSAELQDGRRVQLNAAPNMGQAFAPMELFLVALTGCTAMDVQWIMKKQRQEVQKLEVQVRGTRRDEDPRYYETIDLDYTVAGPKIRKDAVERAIRLSQQKYCSVRAMLKADVKVNISYRIEDRTGVEQLKLHAAPPISNCFL